MTDAQLVDLWLLGLAIAAVVVLVAAALLVAILIVARSILGHAERAHAAVTAIAEDTDVIWELEATNETVGQILMTTESIAEHGGQIAQALHAPAVPGSREA